MPRTDTPRTEAPRTEGPRTAALPATAAGSTYRRGFGRRLGPKLLLLATLILVVDALVGDKGLLERLRGHQRFREVSSSLDTLRQENATLREQSRRLREEDPATIESAARRQLGMIKPGEVLFIVKDVDLPQAQVPSTSPSGSPSRSPAPARKPSPAPSSSSNARRGKP